MVILEDIVVFFLLWVIADKSDKFYSSLSCSLLLRNETASDFQLIRCISAAKLQEIFVRTAGTPAVLLTKSGDLQVKHMFFPNTPVLFFNM